MDWLRKQPVALGIIVTVYVLLTSLFLSWWHRPPYLKPFKEGEVWPYEDLFAPFEFRIFKSTQEQQEELDSLVQRFSMVFQKDTTVAQQVGAQIEALASRLSEPLRQALRTVADYAYRYGYTETPLEGKLGVAFLRYDRQTERLIALDALVDRGRLERWIASQIPPKLQDSVRLWVSALFVPDTRYDPQASEERLRFATQNLSPYSGLVRKGELIVRRGELISSASEQKLHSLRVAYATLHPLGNRFLSLLGAVFLVGIITFIALRYLYLSRRFHPDDLRPILLLLTVFFLITAGTATFMHFYKSLYESVSLPLYHLVPLAIGPLMLAIFFDDRVGFISAITLGAQVSLVVETPVEFFFVHGLSSMLTVFRLGVMQRRSHLFYALATLGLGYTLTFVGYHLFRIGGLQGIPWTGLPVLYANLALCLAVYPLIYLVEKIFRMSSDITFLELLDTNHPLLKELAAKAPGTFQHSLAVAALAEAAAQRLGAHPLKAHVMALFHDIGKVEAPQFFIENLSAISQGAITNPHHALTPRESAEIIRRHVEYGVYLARRSRLPKEIIDGIRTHHGTTCIQYFWEKQKQLCPQEAHLLADEFHYPGPLPHTKEEAILMLADSLEASTRALADLDPEKLRKHVQRIIHARITEGQLEEAQLTLQQLKELEEVFYQRLLSQHHARIRYPERTPQPAL